MKNKYTQKIGFIILQIVIFAHATQYFNFRLRFAVHANLLLEELENSIFTVKFIHSISFRKTFPILKLLFFQVHHSQFVVKMRLIPICRKYEVKNLC